MAGEKTIELNFLLTGMQKIELAPFDEWIYVCLNDLANFV